MTSALTLSVLIMLVPSPRSQGSPPAITQAETGAWAVIHAGQLFVCWEPSPDCWRRITLAETGRQLAHELDENEEESIELAVSAPTSTRDGLGWRLGFWGPRTLWIERDGQRWRVERGQRHARATDSLPPVSLTRPRVHTCAAHGSIPAWQGGRLGWRLASSCETRAPSTAPPTSCVASHTVHGTRRRPSPLHIRAGLQLTVVRRATSRGDRARGLDVARSTLRSGLELVFVIELGLDLAAAQRERRTQAALDRQPDHRVLPTVPPGPLADAERRALATVVCGEVGR